MILKDVLTAIGDFEFIRVYDSAYDEERPFYEGPRDGFPWVDVDMKTPKEGFFFAEKDENSDILYLAIIVDSSLD